MLVSYLRTVAALLQALAKLIFDSLGRGQTILALHSLFAKIDFEHWLVQVYNVSIRSTPSCFGTKRA